jgi:transglutaminase-like putative cysteine protease
MRERELIFLTMYSAVPLYATQGVSRPAVALFHLAMLVVLVVRRVRTDAIASPALLKAMAVGYLLFFPIDGIFISRSLIAASTHLVFFIAVYQAIESTAPSSHGRRLLVLFLIFVSSIATATHISVLPFIAAFAFLAIRQLMYLTHDESEKDVGQEVPRPPVLRPAVVSLLAATGFGAVLFPMLPRVHNPLVRGFAGSLQGATTGLSETIDFRVARSISPDGSVVARVWMPREAVPFFAPLRLRGRVYDAYENEEWRPARRGIRSLDVRDGRVTIARPSGFNRRVAIQQTVDRNARLYPPAETYAITGVNALYESSNSYRVTPGTRGVLNYDAFVSRHTLPLADVAPPPLDYPISPEVQALARQIAGNFPPQQSAARIETYMATRFTYVPDPASLGRVVSVDDFLLRERRGHCEYFAAGMVVLLKAVGISSRVVGGFYGGRLNPLTGYFVVQRNDAHAWVEVYDGEKWLTFDPTPPSLRPGNSGEGLVKAYASALGDSINYLWDRYVLTFGFADQVAVIAAAIEAVSRGMVGMKAQVREIFSVGMLVRVLAIATGIVLGALLVGGVRRRRRPLYLRMLRRLERIGIDAPPSMTATEIVAAVEEQRPDLAPAVRAIVDDYLHVSFSQKTVSPERRLRADEAFRELRSQT